MGAAGDGVDIIKGMVAIKWDYMVSNVDKYGTKSSPSWPADFLKKWMRRFEF